MPMPGRHADGTFKKGHRSTRRRRKARAAEARRSTRRHTVHVAAAAPAPRRRRRRARAAAAPKRRSTHSRRSSRRAPVNVAIVQPTARSTRSHYGRRTSRPRRMREPPIMRAGGIGLFFVGGSLGALAADLAGRYVSGLSPAAYAASGATQPTYPTPQSGATAITDVTTYNEYVQAARPGMYSIGVQLALSIAGFVFGGMANAPSIKAILYGFGVGAGLHLVTQLANAYILEPLFSGSDAGARMYRHEWTADGRMGAGTMSGPPLPGQMGTPPQLQQGSRGTRVPTALATLRAAMPGNPFMGAVAAPIMQQAPAPPPPAQQPAPPPPQQFPQQPAPPPVQQQANGVTPLQPSSPPLQHPGITPIGPAPSGGSPGVETGACGGCGSACGSNAGACATCATFKRNVVADLSGHSERASMLGEPPAKVEWFNHPLWQAKLATSRRAAA